MGSAETTNAPLSKLCGDTPATIANPPGRIYEKHKLGVSPTEEVVRALQGAAAALKAAKSSPD